MSLAFRCLVFDSLKNPDDDIPVGDVWTPFPSASDDVRCPVRGSQTNAGLEIGLLSVLTGQQNFSRIVWWLFYHIIN